MSQILLIAYGASTNPIGLASIYYYLKELEDHDVHFLHMWDDIRITKQQKKNLNPDFIGISCYTIKRKALPNVLQAVKKAWPKARIIIGGRHFVEDTLNMKSEQPIIHAVDHIVIGEGEYAMKDIIEGRETTKVIYGKPLSGWDFQNIPLPEPAFVEKYMMAFLEKKQPATLLSRGCPFSCHFCSESRQVLRKDPEYSAWYIAWLERYFGWKELFIYDDIFGLNKDWLNWFGKALKARNVQTKFRVFIHGKTFDEEILDLFIRIGVHKISLGAESGDDNVLKAINKKATVSDYLNIHRLLYPHRKKILLHCLWMIGNITETKETMKATVELSKRIGTDNNPFFGFAIPFPGSVFWKERNKHGMILSYKWSRWNNRSIIFVPHGTTKEEMQKYYNLGRYGH